MAPRGRQTGRIHPHQRQTDDTTTTIAGEGISAEHQANVFDKATKPQTMNHLHLQQQNHEQQSNLPHRSNLEARTGTTILRSWRYVSDRIRILLLLAVPKLQQWEKKDAAEAFCCCMCHIDSSCDNYQFLCFHHFLRNKIIMERRAIIKQWILWRTAQTKRHSITKDCRWWYCRCGGTVDGGGCYVLFSYSEDCRC